MSCNRPMQNMTSPLTISLTRNVLASRPLKLAAFLLLGNLFPSLVYLEVTGSGLNTGDSQLIVQNLFLTCAASLSAWFFQARLNSYSRTSRLAMVLPTTFTSFAVAYFVILFSRLSFSVAILSITFVATLAVGYFFAALTGTRSVQRYVIPGGRVDEVFQEFKGNTAVLESPDLANLKRSRNGSIVVLADLHCEHAPEWEAFLAQLALHSIPVFHYKQLWETFSGQVRVDRLSENNFGSLLPNIPYLRLKRFADALISIVLLPFLLPVFLVVAIVIKLQSKGPVFFMQDRVGYRGETFKMIKFRTMVTRDAAFDEEGRREDSITDAQDARITPFGRVLRRYRIDELPQIFNILKGEMAWIGPRPEAISLSNWYSESIPFYPYRHVVRPGVTGWAQVHQGHVADIDSVNDKLRFDFYYIKYFSYWLDILIAMKTVRVILGGFGAK